MKVFISWSGGRSRRLAEVLRDWLPDVIQDLKPWVSFEDIAKGKRWNDELSKTLDDAYQGIVCVTRENMHSPWLNFEAGALAKRLEGSTGGQVRPILLDVRPADVTGPLASFQATEIANRDDVFKLLQSLDQSQIEGRSRLGDERLKRYFDTFWPVLQERVGDALKLSADEVAAPVDLPEKTGRDERDMLAELLETVRRLERRADQTSSSVPTLTSGTLPRSTLGGVLDVNLQRLVGRDPSVFNYRLMNSVVEDARGSESPLDLDLSAIDIVVDKDGKVLGAKRKKTDDKNEEE